MILARDQARPWARASWAPAQGPIPRRGPMANKIYILRICLQLFDVENEESRIKLEPCTPRRTARNPGVTPQPVNHQPPKASR